MANDLPAERFRRKQQNGLEWVLRSYSWYSESNGSTPVWERYATQEEAALAAEVERLRALILSALEEAEGMLAMPADEWAERVRKAAKAAGDA